MNLTDALDAIEGATRDLKMPSYYRDMLLRGHPAYLSAHHRDSNLMSELARGKRDRPWLRVQRRHFYLAFQGL